MAKRGTKPPYTATADVESFFDRIETIAAPKKLDKPWVESFLPTVKQPGAIPALVRWLGIIGEDGAATPAIWNKVRMPKTRPDALAPLVHDAYSDVFEGVTVEKAIRDDLDGIFVTTYEGMGDSQRYVGCFLTLCQLAGIPTAAVRDNNTATTNGSGSPIAAKKTAARQSKKQTPPKIPARTNEFPPAFSASGAMIVLNVEIPASWTEVEIRERISVVSRAVREAGVAQT